MALSSTVGGPAVVQGASPVTASYTYPAGSLLVAMVCYDTGYPPGGADNPSSVSGGGLSWTLVKRYSIATTGKDGGVEVWSAPCPAGGALTVTAADANGTGEFRAVFVRAFTDSSGEVPDIGPNTGLSNGGDSNGGSGGLPSMTLTTTRDGSWVWAVLNDWWITGAGTYGTGQVKVQEFEDSARQDARVWRRTGTTASAGTSVMMNMTAPTDQTWNAVAFEVRPPVVTVAHTGSAGFTGVGSFVHSGTTVAVARTANLSGSGSLSGAGSAVVAASATRALTGSGTLTASGAAALTAHGAGALSGAGVLAGSGWASTSSTGTAAFTGTGTLTTGTGVPDVAAAAGFTGSGDLTGSGLAAYGDSASVSLTGSGDLVASPTPALPGAGALTGGGVLSGAPQVAMSGAAVLGGTGTLTGVGSGIVAFTGTGALTGGGIPHYPGTGALTGSGVLTPSDPSVYIHLNPPDVVSADPQSASAVHLSWSAVPTATGYDVERDGQVIASGLTATMYTDIGLGAATQHTYRVRSTR